MVLSLSRPWKAHWLTITSYVNHLPSTLSMTMYTDLRSYVRLFSWGFDTPHRCVRSHLEPEREIEPGSSGKEAAALPSEPSQHCIRSANLGLNQLGMCWCLLMFLNPSFHSTITYSEFCLVRSIYFWSLWTVISLNYLKQFKFIFPSTFLICFDQIFQFTSHLWYSPCYHHPLGCFY